MKSRAISHILLQDVHQPNATAIFCTKHRSLILLALRQTTSLSQDIVWYIYFPSTGFSAVALVDVRFLTSPCFPFYRKQNKLVSIQSP